MKMPGLNGEMESIVLCDAIAQSSGKHSLIGVFDRIWTQSFPCTYSHIAVYLRLRLPEGQHKVELQISDPDQTVIFKTSPPMEVTLDRDDITSELCVNLTRPVFPVEGEYWFQCLINGQIQDAVSYRLTVAPQAQIED